MPLPGLSAFAPVVIALTSEMLEVSHGSVQLLALFTSDFLLCWFPEITVLEQK